MLSTIREKLVSLKNNNPWLYYVWLENHKRKGIRNLKELTDIEAIAKLYQNYCGVSPNIDSPKDWGEKMQWLKLNYHNPLQTLCSHKFEVRKYIIGKGFGHTLNEVILNLKDVNSLRVENLPNQFVAKASHGSGWNLICRDKSQINWFIWKKIFKNWLTNNIFWEGREWPYRNMEPSIVFEKYLEDESGALMDYKFFCFDGEVHFVQANKGRGTERHAQNFYDLEWNILPFGKDLVPLPDVDIPKPKLFDEMITMAKELSGDFPFVRVDLYETNKRIIFGELTFYPKSGLPDYTPSEYNSTIGDLLNLP